MFDREVVDVHRLRLGLSPRSVDDRHVELLAQSPGSLPPVLVHRDTLTVVDGVHRLFAARRSGQRSIAVVWFEGTIEEASIEAVRANVSHGKPLTLEERRRAAKRILVGDPSRSDRAVAEICGLSPKTVGAVRLQASEEIPHTDAVIGRDGRTRPRNAGGSRPTLPGSLPETPAVPSAATGVPEEAPKAVEEMNSLDDDSSSLRSFPSGRPAAPLEVPAGRADVDRLAWWELDEAMSSRCPRLCAWLTATNLGDDSWKEMLETLPASRAYRLADEARRRAAVWLELAAEVERMASR